MSLRWDRRLLNSETVGTAVLSARRALEKDRNPDWVNYTLYGDTELRW